MITKESLSTSLHENVLKINFTKKDGADRTMICTLQEKIVPKQEIKENKKPKKQNENILAVWDLEKNAFRSFRLDSLTNFEIIKEGYEL